MFKFNQVSANAFNNIVLQAGMILKNFDPENPIKPADADIITATNGGFNPKCVPKTLDIGADMDNVPEKTKELLRIIGYDCSLGFTGMNLTKETLALALGCTIADGNKLVPSSDVKDEHFKDIWVVGDMSGNGWWAICLKNAFSTDGLSIQTGKNNTGKMTITLTGFYSIKNTNECPMEFYVTEAVDTGE